MSNIPSPNKRSRTTSWLVLGSLLTLMLATAACSSIDCPLNNQVYANYRFYDEAGDSTTFADTLTITTRRIDGMDSVLINKQTGTVHFALPVSYNRHEDEFYLNFKGTNYELTDTIRVTKEDMPHFESVDCNPAYYHTAIEVMCTHNLIDSVVINNKTINHDATKEHFKVYIYTGR